MFTGIIEWVGKIISLQRLGRELRLRIKCSAPVADFKRGESIAINGVCLTVETFGPDWFEVYASAATPS